MQKIQCIVVGESCVGKTSFLHHAIEGSFRDDITPTVGVDNILFRTKRYTLQCWDTSGNNRFEKVIPLFSETCQVAIYVFDVSRPETLERIHYWHNLISTPPVNILLANRFDLTNRCGDLDDISQRYPEFILMDGRKHPKDILKNIISLSRTFVHKESFSIDSGNELQTCCFGFC